MAQEWSGVSLSPLYVLLRCLMRDDDESQQFKNGMNNILQTTVNYSWEKRNLS
jgi:hypothetical protein